MADIVNTAIILMPITAMSHMEVGCPGTWPEHPRACPTCNPATSRARQKNPGAARAPAPAPITLTE